MQATPSLRLISKNCAFDRCGRILEENIYGREAPGPFQIDWERR